MYVSAIVWAIAGTGGAHGCRGERLIDLEREQWAEDKT